MRKSQTPPKPELRPAQKRCVRNPSTRVRTVLFETVKKEGESRAVAGQTTWRNPAWTKTKIMLIGNACEKAKYHLNPSADKPKNDAFATRPHGSETSASKPLKNKKATQPLGKKRGATQPGQRQKSSSSAMHAKKPNAT